MSEVNYCLIIIFLLFFIALCIIFYARYTKQITPSDCACSSNYENQRSTSSKAWKISYYPLNHNPKYHRKFKYYIQVRKWRQYQRKHNVTANIIDQNIKTKPTVAPQNITTKATIAPKNIIEAPKAPNIKQISTKLIPTQCLR